MNDIEFWSGGKLNCSNLTIEYNNRISVLHPPNMEGIVWLNFIYHLLSERQSTEMDRFALMRKIWPINETEIGLMQGAALTILRTSQEKHMCMEIK